MKNNLSSKILICALFLIVLVISLLIGFNWEVTATYENAKTIWLISKIVVSVILVLQMVLVILPKSRFSTSLPTTITVGLLQLAPMIARIHFKNSAAIILLLVILFLFVLLYGVRFLSNKKMLEDEDRAKHSSNYQGE